MPTEQQFIFGIHSVESLLSKHPDRVIRLCILHERHDKKINRILELAKQNDIHIDYLSKPELERLARTENHQGVIAFAKQSPVLSENNLSTLIALLDEAPFILILDGVQDPHNLGACLRSADAAGVHLVIAPKDKSVGITPTVSKVASGAAETVPFIQVTNLVRTLELLKELGIWIYGASADAAQTLYQTKLTGPIAIVLGAEGQGLRRLTQEHCDALVKIPMRGTIESLNVSVATGIFLFEAVRQRAKK